jgi:hypothetical protein
MGTPRAQGSHSNSLTDHFLTFIRFGLPASKASQLQQAFTRLFIILLGCSLSPGVKNKMSRKETTQDTDHIAA